MNCPKNKQFGVVVFCSLSKFSGNYITKSLKNKTNLILDLIWLKIQKNLLLANLSNNWTKLSNKNLRIVDQSIVDNLAVTK
ncbi:hypothetical protein BpHYR1_032865 [Brachionus plicatilis]|uniref:Uncharacterized protein n=1 Tax=Brachionus plicatilis TaxID=10195 RepID=A0A3M7Q1L5_BRAPC|nr:hypothetical protein BpHYR1_032865 [Brachionus plicatilis]